MRHIAGHALGFEGGEHVFVDGAIGGAGVDFPAGFDLEAHAGDVGELDGAGEAVGVWMEAALDVVGLEPGGGEALAGPVVDAGGVVEGDPEQRELGLGRDGGDGLDERGIGWGLEVDVFLIPVDAGELEMGEVGAGPGVEQGLDVPLEGGGARLDGAGVVAGGVEGDGLAANLAPHAGAPVWVWEGDDNLLAVDGFVGRVGGQGVVDLADGVVEGVQLRAGREQVAEEAVPSRLLVGDGAGGQEQHGVKHAAVDGAALRHVADHGQEVVRRPGALAGRATVVDEQHVLNGVIAHIRCRHGLAKLLRRRRQLREGVDLGLRGVDAPDVNLAGKHPTGDGKVNHDLLGVNVVVMARHRFLRVLLVPGRNRTRHRVGLVPVAILLDFKIDPIRIEDANARRLLQVDGDRVDRHVDGEVDDDVAPGLLVKAVPFVRSDQRRIPPALGLGELHIGRPAHAHRVRGERRKVVQVRGGRINGLRHTRRRGAVVQLRRDRMDRQSPSPRSQRSPRLGRARRQSKYSEYQRQNQAQGFGHLNNHS